MLQQVEKESRNVREARGDIVRAFPGEAAGKSSEPNNPSFNNSADTEQRHVVNIFALFSSK